MKEKDNKTFDEDSKYIPGIYNYCDRWCERCEFTSRCMSCTLADEKFGDPDAHDINSEAFWQKIGETLQEALNMLKEMAEEQGIDLDSIDLEENGKLEKQLEDKTVISIISHMSKTYITMVDNWLDANVYLLEGMVYEQNNQSNLKLVQPEPGEPLKNDVTIEEAFEVIRWYQFQIHVKLKRAIGSHQREDSLESNGFPKDSDGSAKVALLGIDRSISAWNALLNHLPELKEGILPLSIHLSRLRDRVESEFPNARAFIRPGFDEVK